MGESVEELIALQEELNGVREARRVAASGVVLLPLTRRVRWRLWVRANRRLLWLPVLAVVCLVAAAVFAAEALAAPVDPIRCVAVESYVYEWWVPRMVFVDGRKARCAGPGLEARRRR